MSLSLFKSLIPKASVLPSDASPLSEERLDLLKRFGKALKVKIGDGILLNEALTHKSFSHERKMGAGANNEKLEFLGDSVLGLVVSEHVFMTFPNVTEGALSKVKSAVVSAATLAEKAVQAGLGEYLQLGKGEEKTGGRTRPALLADALEAVIGAVYLEGGLTAARKLVLSLMKDEIEKVFLGSEDKDYKTLLQEHYQKHLQATPRYQVVREWGPDHNRSFEAECLVNNKSLSKGEGKSKKEAEQAAAFEALKYLKEAAGRHS